MPPISGHTDHSRLFGDNSFVYPVLSRRSGGISVGVNLSPDQRCNFNCVYCQVDRTERRDQSFDADRLAAELESTLQCIDSGAIYDVPPFDDTPAALRRLNDIALSGDGEPTASPHFAAACKRIVAVREALGLGDVKIVVITNASCLGQPDVAAAIEFLHNEPCEIWAKLDAGTPEDFQRINGCSSVSYDTILDNITRAAQRHPIVIQSLFLRMDGVGPTDAQIDAYIARLARIVDDGGAVKLVQLHSVARKGRLASVSALSHDELTAIADRMTATVPLNVQVY